jgi:TolA-binding protein
MPIEGPLRELDIHDVFQLLDLSRKTGLLRVTSQLRDDEGVVYFDGGRVVHASIRSRPARLETGALSERELERKIRQQIETTVFDLMSWREGFFSFEERAVTDMPGETRVKVTTESLLMESARRIDEWSRIADKVPNLAVIPTLAPVSEDHETKLELLPHEWEVLTMIDGQRDVRAIAAALRRGEFEVAKVAYGLATTGVVELRQPPPASASVGVPPSPPPEAQSHLDLGFTAVRVGNLSAARASFEHFLQLVPNGPGSERARTALDGVTRLLTAMEAHGDG